MLSSQLTFTQIKNTDFADWQKFWSLYEISFPKIERRTLHDMKRALENAAFHCFAIYENKLFIGIFTYWENDSFLYLEHLAVSPEIRSGGYGGKILDFVKRKKKNLILEIEPLNDEQAVRRLTFYERQGFHLTPYKFLQLPYRKQFSRIELLILSYPQTITNEEFFAFQQFMTEEVAEYCEL